MRILTLYKTLYKSSDVQTAEDCVLGLLRVDYLVRIE